MKKFSKKLLAVILSVLMVLSLLPSAFADSDGGSGSDSTILVACSDFQNYEDSNNGNYSGSYTNNVAFVQKVLRRMGYDSIDGFVCGGDYNYCQTGSSTTQTKTGIDALRNAVTGVYSDLDTNNMVFAQGNHDAADTEGMASTGNNDAHTNGAYGLFIINEDDYPYQGGTLAKAQSVANSLDTYLDAKDGSGIPVFILAHVPLHFSTRTYKDGDGKYAKPIFDVIQEHGDDVNIIYLFGHDHSRGYDSYLGGSSIFLPVGDKINIAAQGSNSTFTEETLKFNYMTAGYTGYFRFNNGTGSTEVTENGDADGTLTMTSFEINGNSVTVRRWDGEDDNPTGVHVLKSAGEQITKSIPNNDLTKYDPDLNIAANKTVYQSGYTVGRSKNIYHDNTTDVTVETYSDLGTVTVVYGEDNDTMASIEDMVKYVTYDITPSGSLDTGDTATVKLPVPTAFNRNRLVLYYLNGTTATPVEFDYANGYVTFETNHFSVWGLGEAEGQSVTWHEIEREAGKEYRYVLDTDGVDSGSRYLIVDDTNAKAFHDTGTQLNSVDVTINDNEIRTKDRKNEWTFTKQSGTQTGSSHQVPAYVTQTVNYSSTGTYDTTGLYYKDGDNYKAVTGITTTETDGLKKWVITYDGGSVTYEDHTNYENQTISYSGSGYSTYYNGDDYMLVDGEYERITSVACSRSGSAIFGYNYTWTIDFADGTTYYTYSDDETISRASSGKYTSYENNGYYYKNGGQYYLITSLTSTGSGSSTKWNINNGQFSDSGRNLSVSIKTKPSTSSVTALKQVTVSYPSVTLYKMGTEASTDYDVWRIVSTQRNNNNYVNLSDALALGNTTNADLTVSDDGSGLYKIARFYRASNYSSTYYTANMYYGTTWTSKRTSGTSTSRSAPTEQVRLYKYVEEVDIPAQPVYATLGGQTAFAIPVGCTEAEALSMLTKNKVFVLENLDAPSETGATKYALSETDHVELRARHTFSSVEGAENIYDVYYIDALTGNTELLGDVTLATKLATGIALKDELAGTVLQDADATTSTGATLVVTYDDGSTEEIPVTVGMLDLNGPVSTANSGTFAGLNVKYSAGSRNFTLTNTFTLYVVEHTKNDYPDYPKPGSVQVNKSAKGVNFNQTGVVKVELSASGIPYSKGVDVIVMIDTSSSMKRVPENSPSGTPERYKVFAPAFKNLIDSLQSSESDVQIAIGDFNGFSTYTNGNVTSSTYPYAADSTNDMPADGKTNSGAGHNGHLFTGSNVKYNNGSVTPYTVTNSLDATAFSSVHDIDKDALNTWFMDTNHYYSGTNYDYAFWAVYQMGMAKKAANIANGDDARDLIVIFMTDGVPTQYNGYLGDGNSTSWAQWFDGTINGASVSTNTADYTKILTQRNSGSVSNPTWTTSGITNTHGTLHEYYFNSDINEYGQKNRWNEAVKGSPSRFYEVIDKSSTSADWTATGQYMVEVPGLGAQIYSIGFELSQDYNLTKASAQHMTHQMASDQKLVFEVEDASELEEAFASISGDVVEAATGAAYDDTMGDDFDLQLASYTKDAEGNTQPLGFSPEITVSRYNVYLNSDIGTVKNGVTVTADMVGNRYGSEEVLETVTFNTDGTEAYSTKVSGNILDLETGIIEANTFWYNTSGANRLIDANGDGIPEYTLKPETFYWKMGKVSKQEMVLSYYAYLTGFKEGEVDAGVYYTNEQATLTYTNWCGHNVSQTAPVPSIMVDGAQVSFAFYLVNTQGQVLMNLDGEVAPNFNQRYVVTNPEVYSLLKFNSSATNLDSMIIAKDNLPGEYHLYNQESKYSVRANSDGTGYWEIDDSGLAVQTTYVTGYNPENANAYTNSNTPSTDYNYLNTTVWFAVVYETAALPDTIVVDYGLPVKAHVLKNDMLGADITLFGVYDGIYSLANSTSVNNFTSTTDSQFKHDVTTEVGTFAVSGDAIEFTPASMTFTNTYTISYAAIRSYENNLQTFYGTLKVVPATTLYFEDHAEADGGFITYTDDALGTDTGIWMAKGSAEFEYQNEDRPGTYSLPSVDANDLYGSDSNYGTSVSYSQGSAHHVVVSAANNPNAAYSGEEGHNWPMAQFTFKGTGFDLISLTNNTTGLINVKVYSGSDTTTLVKSYVVDNYYGYSSEFVGYKKYTWKYGNNHLWTICDEEEIDATEFVQDDAIPKNPVVGMTIHSYEKKYDWVTENENSMYQVPVIRVPGLTYGTYTVVIQVTYSSKFDHNTAGEYGFYLDAVRIYDPANNGGDALNYYKEDHEAYPTYTVVRDNILTAKDLDEDGAVTGAVFLDGISSSNDIYNFEKVGPNNEVYLGPGQAVAFTLTSDNAANIDATHLGMKALRTNSNIKMKVSMANGGSTTITTSSASDLYYDISSVVTYKDGATDVIVIQNTGSSVLSITYIKTTYKALPPAKGPLMMSSPRTLKTAKTIMAATMVNEMPQEEEEPVTEENEKTEEKPAEQESEAHVGGVDPPEAVITESSEKPEANDHEAQEIKIPEERQDSKEEKESGPAYDATTEDADEETEISVDTGAESEEKDTRNIFEMIWDAIVDVFNAVVNWFKSIFAQD